MKILRKLLLSTVSVAVMLLLASCSRKNTLHVYIWCDYISEEVVEKFEKQYNCKVQQDIFDSNEMMFAKLQQGGSGYDIVCPSHYYIHKMAATKMIVPLDWSKLPNAKKNLDPEVLKKFNPEVLAHSVPYFMSYTGLGYNKTQVKDFEPSWSIFLREDMKNRMTLLDDYIEVIGAAARSCGFTIQEVLEDSEKLQKAVDEARRWRENIIKFDNEQYKNGLATGEFIVVMGYFSDLSQIIAENEGLALAMPKEGSMMSCDMLAIPSTAKNVDLAYAFIDFVHQPENAAQNITDVYAYCPNIGALEFLDDEVKNDTSIFVEGEGVDKCILTPELSPEEEAKILEAWSKIKR